MLSATAPPAPDRADSNARWVRILRFVPIGLVRGLLRLVLRKLLEPVQVEKDFWRRFYAAAFADFGKEDLLARYRVSIDFDRRGAPASKSRVDCKLLILEGAEDRLAKADVRGAMRAVYPRARFHTFDGAGHGIALERP